MSSADESGTYPTTGARTLLLPDPASRTKGKPKATPWTDQTHGDGWKEDATTVLWHVAGFEEMTYSKQSVATTAVVLSCARCIGCTCSRETDTTCNFVRRLRVLQLRATLDKGAWFL
jgi:hypothetical protein